MAYAPSLPVQHHVEQLVSREVIGNTLLENVVQGMILSGDALQVPSQAVEPREVRSRFVTTIVPPQT